MVPDGGIPHPAESDLDQDLRKIPKEFAVDPATRLKDGEGVVLQLVSWRNVSQPQHRQHAGDSGIVALVLTDGSNEIRALDVSGCLPSTKQLVPGVKVRLEPGCRTRYGFFQVDPYNFKILGGRVDALADAYEANLMYGNAERSRESLAPKFLQFDPTRPIVRPVTTATAVSRMVKTEGTYGNKINEKTGDKPNHSHLVGMMEERSSGRRGRGEGQRGRRRFDKDDDDGVTMTMEEYEARKKTGSGILNPASSSTQEEQDLLLAMALQEQLDMEAIEAIDAERRSGSRIEFGFQYGSAPASGDVPDAGGRCGRGRGGRSGGRRGGGRGEARRGRGRGGRDGRRSGGRGGRGG